MPNLRPQRCAHLHLKHLGVRRRPIQMSDESFLQTLTRRAKLLPQSLFVLRIEGRKSARDFDILRQHFRFRHSHDCGRYRQAHGISQQRLHICLPGTITYKKLLPSNLHGNHTQILLVGCGECQFFEAAITGGIEGHLYAIKIVSFDSLGHHLSVGMAGHASEARHLLLTCLHQALHRPVRRLNFRQIVSMTETVDVYEVHMVCPKPFETSFEAPQESIARTIWNLRCEPHFLASRRHHLTDSALALTISVCKRRVEITDPGIDGTVKNCRGTLFILVHEEAASAAESKD